MEARGRVTAVVVTVIAIALLVIAAVSTQWLVTGSGTGFGLRELRVCHAHGCDSTVISRLPVSIGARSGFAEGGLIALITVWAAAGALLVAMLPVLAGVRSGVALALSRVALLLLVVALGGAVAFVLRQPGGTSATALKLGFGFWMFAGGNVIGMTAAQMLAKLHRREIPS